MKLLMYGVVGSIIVGMALGIGLNQKTSAENVDPTLYTDHDGTSYYDPFAWRKYIDKICPEKSIFTDENHSFEVEVPVACGSVMSRYAGPHIVKRTADENLSTGGQITVSPLQVAGKIVGCQAENVRINDPQNIIPPEEIPLIVEKELNVLAVCDDFAKAGYFEGHSFLTLAPTLDALALMYLEHQKPGSINDITGLDLTQNPNSEAFKSPPGADYFNYETFMFAQNLSTTGVTIPMPDNPLGVEYSPGN
jgi:hypothetical protein